MSFSSRRPTSPSSLAGTTRRLRTGVSTSLWIGGEKGRIQCFLVDGSTPLLVGRPVLKALKVKLDYDQDMCSVMGRDPTVALKGDRGEYLLALP